MRKYIKSLQKKSEEELRDEYQKHMELVGSSDSIKKVRKSLEKARIVIGLLDALTEEGIGEENIGNSA